MPFKVTARTILQLGGELISSDGIAFYELIKNAFDAGSKKVQVDVVSLLPVETIESVLADLSVISDDQNDDEVISEVIESAKQRIRKYAEPTAKGLNSWLESINATEDVDELISMLLCANSITFTDFGHGMSLKDLNDFYLTIGTPKALTTELFAISGQYYAIEWKPKQMVSIPQCCLRAQLQDRGYSHDVRLQMDRAIELQQEAFASNGRVGLEVQPQLSRTVGLRISARIAGEFKTLGDDILRAGGIFHTRNKTVLVMNHDCLVETMKRLSSHAHADFSDALQQLEECRSELYRCPFIADRDSQTTFKLIKPNNLHHSCKKIRVGLSSQPQSVEKCDGQLYLHFFDQWRSNAN